jgi:hypothetical protein
MAAIFKVLAQMYCTLSLASCSLLWPDKSKRHGEQPLANLVKNIENGTNKKVTKSLRSRRQKIQTCPWLHNTTH